MPTPDPYDDDDAPTGKEAPLSPEAAAVIGRARRSFLFSIGLLVVGFIAIGGALVYRASRDPGPNTAASVPANAYAASALQLPSGAEVVSAVAAGGTVTVTYQIGPATQVRVFDGATGAMTAQFDILR